jgi:cell wall assembly regulator SMI1
MKDLWEALERWAGAQIPELVQGFRPEATDKRLDALERHVGFRLPEDFRRFYRVHDGQAEGAPGLIYGMPLLPLEALARRWDEWAEIAATWTDNEFEVCKAGAKIRPVFAIRGWLPFAHDWGGNHLGLDLDPDREGVPGQVINFGRDEQEKYMIASSFRGFVSWLVHLLQAGNFRISRTDGKVFVHTAEPATRHFLDAIKKMKLPG